MLPCQVTLSVTKFLIEIALLLEKLPPYAKNTTDSCFPSFSSVLHYNLEHCILSYFAKNAIVIIGKLDRKSVV